MKYIILIMAVLLAISCRTISSKTETVSAEQVADNLAVKNTGENLSKIRKIDFQNFMFPWTENFGGEKKSFTLKNGILKLSDERRLSLETLSYTANEDKALIVVKIDDGNATYKMLYVYEIENKKTKLMESFEFGENNIYFGTAFEAHGELVIETYHQSITDSECCPSVIEIAYYKWTKNKFVLQGEPQKIANGYVERFKKK